MFGDRSQRKALGTHAHFVTFKDDFSGHLTVYFMKKKSEVLYLLRLYAAMLLNNTGFYMLTLRSDNGRAEYVNSENSLVQEMRYSSRVKCSIHTWTKRSSWVDVPDSNRHHTLNAYLKRPSTSTLYGSYCLHYIHPQQSSFQNQSSHLHRKQEWKETKPLQHSHLWSKNLCKDPEYNQVRS